jgi:hypothetical protein
MARYSLSLPTDFELPALISVGGLLVAITLTKGGYALWAVGGMVFLYWASSRGTVVKTRATCPIDQVRI